MLEVSPLFLRAPPSPTTNPRILFRSQDLSEVKDYCTQTWNKVLDNKVSVQDFIFAKEVRMGTYRSVFGSYGCLLQCSPNYQ